jgi:hypothetical protein
MPDGEFFVAHVEEVDAPLADDGPVGRYPVAEANNLTSVELATLGEILGVGSYDELVVSFEDGGRPSASGEAALLLIPTEYRNAIAALDDVAAVAAAWTATEELALSGYRAEDAVVVLSAVSELARQAQTDGRELWIWASL